MVETLIVIFIFVLIFIVVSTLLRDLFVNNSYLQQRLSAQQEIRSALKKMSSEIRPAATSNTGAYTIGVANVDEFMFYSDTDNDGLYERIRYYFNGLTLERGIIAPTGAPLTYVGPEKISTLITNVSTTSIFYYYDNKYTGVGSSLSSPINIIDVRMVKIIVSVDKDPNRPPAPLVEETKIFIRSLKDNS